MKILATNKRLTFKPADDDEDDQLDEFRDETAYFVDGAWHDPDFKKKRWDGYIRLVDYDSKRKLWTAPVGLLAEAMLNLGVGEMPEVIDGRRVLSGSLGDTIWLDPEVIPQLRGYQEKAVQAVLRDRGVRTGKGLLRLPIRSGKTVIAAAIICRLGHRALFVVNSDMLLRQTVRFFEKAIACPDYPIAAPIPLIGQWGGGEKTPGWITVASVQGITRAMDDPEVQQLLADVDIAFFDEAHHLEAETWREAMTECDARYKIGLSATIHLSKDGGTPKGSIWLVGSTGPVLYSLTPSELIEMGWLNTPEITFITSPDPNISISEGSTFATQYRDGVVKNAARNAEVARCAFECVRAGLRPLVTASRLDHVDRLHKAMEDVGLTVAVVTGKTPAEDREALCLDVKEGRADVLLGTVFGEAVDLPFLEAVIVADGMASKVLTMQRLRNLTPVDENDRPRLVPMETPVIVPVFEFADFCTPMMARHALARLQAYREHPRFIVRWDQ